MKLLSNKGLRTKATDFTPSLMHLLDLRWKKDAQLEAQKLCELLYLHFETWMPALAHWYLENRAKKARLSP